MLQPLHKFILAHSANALSIGVQLVLVAWLAAGVLQLPAQQIGWVQAAALLPNLLLLLMAGALVDRSHPSRVLLLANLGLAGTHLTGALLLYLGHLNLMFLLVYAMVLAVGNTFVQTAREKVVAQLAGQRLQKTISIAGFCQFGAQGVGIALASMTDWVGPELLLLVQAGACLLALFGYRALRNDYAAGTDGATYASWEAIHSGLRRAWQLRPVRYMVLVVGFNGFMHLGVFIVILPLIARDVMGFSSFEYGMLQLTFIAGTVLLHAVMMHRPPVQYPGQGVMFSVLYAGLISFALSAQPTVFGLFSLVFLWGCVAGNSANLSRVVVQSSVEPTHRGRVMAVYQLALFGLAPLGALFAGYMAQHTNLWLVFKVVGWSSVGLFALSLFSRALWAIKAPEQQHP